MKVLWIGAVIVLAVCAVSLARGQDCNGNGIPDDQEVTVLLQEDFELGFLITWSHNGLWHATRECPRPEQCDPEHWAYYGQDSGCNFDVGSTEGTLSTPPILLPRSTGPATLTYCSTYGGEGGTSPDGRDAAWVSINGTIIDDVSAGGEQLTWTTHTIDLAPFADQTIVVEWHFNSQDGTANTGLGWQIDLVWVGYQGLPDCNGNGIPDACDIADGTSGDCDQNGVPDECQLAAGTSQDCNGNGIPDECDIASGFSADCQHNGIPDECELAAGTSPDCNGNGIPDECDIVAAVYFSLDSDPGWATTGGWAFGHPTGGGSHNHDPDAGFTGPYVYGYNLDGDYPDNLPAATLTTPAVDCSGAEDLQLRFWRWLGVQSWNCDHARVCVSTDGVSWQTVWHNPFVTDTLDTEWTQQVIDLASYAGPTVYIQWVMGPTDGIYTYPGWNIDDVELRWTQNDCNHNQVPDDCELAEHDCNGNGRVDICDLYAGTSKDCNGNYVPDECDLASGTSLDANGNGMPDECETGGQVAERISAATYRYYLDGRLYTHDGNDRGTTEGFIGPEHDPARDNILAIFQELGLSAELQTIDLNGGGCNVVATQLGSVYPDSYYVVGAHYDSAANPGADDDASGVAGLLEIARVLSLYETEYTIKYIAFDLEEHGMVGSAAYVQEHLTDDIHGMIELDMIAHDSGGYAGEVRGTSESEPIKLALADAIGMYGGELNALVGGPQDSDHAPFEWAGFQACLLIEQDYSHNPCVHQLCDSVDTADYVNYAYAADMTRAVAGLLAARTNAQPRFDCATGVGCEPGVGNPDCNGNGVGDLCDVFCGTSADCNGNHIPDECEADCNGNGLPDDCDLASGTSDDFNGNGIPDECEPHRTIYVDDDAPADPGPGTPDVSDPLEDGGPEHPFDSIQEAIADSIPGDSIQVRNGLYKGSGNRDLDFGGRTITVYGETTPEACVIDCEQEGCGFYFHKGETAAALVNGLTVQNGAGNLAGGIACSGASPSIQNCRLIGNAAWGGGPAIYSEYGSPAFSGCYIAQSGGSAAVCASEGYPSFAGCTVVDNPWAYGFYVSAPSATITDCVISGNALGIIGASGTVVVNCLVTGNTDTGIACDGGGTIRNCTISGNGTGLMCVSGVSDVANCVIWGNQLAQISVFLGSPSISYCDVGGGWPGTGNINADPLFVDPADGDYRLAPGSPCIDAGDNNAVPQGTNAGLEGLPRFVDDPSTPDTGNGTPPIVDMGAYEYQWHDCNGNGVADAVDLANGTSTDVNNNGIPDECESVGDLNCDGVTDFGDINPFVLYLSNFGLWQATYAGCDPLNGDINGDGVYGQASFGDINPFVALLCDGGAP
jgi:hypothetical protein